MRALLTIETGQGEPRVFDLHAEQRVTLGRHRNNHIVLHDEHASRWHAEVFCEDNRWFIRDFGALNGTRVNGEVIREQAGLENGQVISIGKTALRFTANGSVNGRDSKPAEPPASSIQQTVLCKDELSVLCQFMAASVRETDARRLIQHALEVVRGQTGASVTGFLSLDSDDPLPRMVLPDLARVDVHLSRKLTQLVQDQGRAVWLGARRELVSESESLLCFADALCVPLQVGETPLGALHVYRSGKAFQEREVRFCEILAGHLASTLHLLRVHRTLQAENSRLRSHLPGTDELVGTSAALQLLRQRIARLAPCPSTVLIVGESGVGKELVALALHRQSPRREGPLVPVNCAAIAPTGMLESALFGHCKGAFTGADRNYPGVFQQADEGTLFLDEVGELPPECQAKLLRVLESKTFRPVGATTDVHADVRILAATNRDLEEEVQAGNFRQDLYFRLQGMQLRVPPLREHAEDIPNLVEYFLSRLAQEWGRQVRLTEAALARLQEYPWPGNVRQLRSVLENAVALSDRDVIEPGDLCLTPGPYPAEPPSLDLENLEAWAIRQALRQTDGNVTRAAKLVGVVRDTLSSKMKRYGISREE